MGLAVSTARAPTERGGGAPKSSGTPLETLRNFGPCFSERFANVGISTVEELLETGVDLVYERLLQAGRRPRFNEFYMIEMSLQGRNWNACSESEKVALRRRFDAIKERLG